MSELTTRDGTETFEKGWNSGQPEGFSPTWPLEADDSVLPPFDGSPSDTAAPS